MRALAFIFLLAIAEAQHFEVASVKPVLRDDDAPSFMRGGPGTNDPEHITYERQTLLRFLTVAYGFDFDQISGPNWLGTESYTIVVKVPPSTTKDQLRLMWQSLLAERFELKSHLIKKDFPVYSLSTAKTGSKLRDSTATPRIPPGFPEPRPGQKWAISATPPRNTRLTFHEFTMAELVQELKFSFGTHLQTWGALAMGRISDNTGLQGRYDFTLEFAGRWRSPDVRSLPPLPDGEFDTAPNLIDALRQQLGLVLEEKRAPTDVLVIDHVQKIPTEN